ncbi:V-set domain-containing T-cell activation inhibitor 1 isoform X2 [Salarias fasciatus]|uniref:Ig-like domain-containing protein n=1 Tax=Salarias fasciatus TaxID=181472 RepID=A0A672GVR7_SALFA|nr:V-set domain-containing T-cell activation inhibitor 1 isoform X2 [Salarias fasciatus]
MATFGQVIFYTIITLIVIFTVVIILIFTITFTSQTTEALSSSTKPIGNVGEDLVLDCYLYSNVVGQDTFTQVSVAWTKADLEGEVYAYRDGAPNLQGQAPQFRGRTQLFPDSISQGNASLLLRSIRLSDQGDYTCSIDSSGGGGEISIHLRTAAFSAPTFSFSNGTLTAVARKWFPRPNVTWVNQTGSLLEASTAWTQSPVGTFAVVSSLQPPHLDETYSCRIENRFVIAVGEATVAEAGVSQRTYFVYSEAAGSLPVSLVLDAAAVVLSMYCVS